MPPSPAPQPSAPETVQKKYSLSSNRVLAFSLRGLFFVVLIAVLIAGTVFLRPQLSGFLARFFPDEGCSASLVLGTRSFEIRTLKLGSDGALDIPANRPDTAYWIEGTEVNYVFGLSPTPENLALETSLVAGEKATLTWSNCNSTMYTLATPQRGMADLSALLDQSISEITIFVQEDEPTTGFVVTGELAEEIINAFNTPDLSEMQAEISLLETTSSADGKNITVSASIQNYGKSVLTLSSSDVSLASENGAAVMPAGTDPALPLEIKPGETQTIYLTFPRPATASASSTLRIFTVEYDIEGY